MRSEEADGIEIRAFTDEYDVAAPLYGVSSESLSASDRLRRPPQQRWLALVDGAAVGAATAALRQTIVGSFAWSGAMTPLQDW